MGIGSKITVLALAGILAAPADLARGQGVHGVADVIETLRAYERALNASDTDAVMALYAADSVFMPQHFPSAVGADQVRAAYDGVFATIRLNVVFDMAEVVPVAPNRAFARTNSVGTVTLLTSGTSEPEANQELFVLQQIDGTWKRARHAFSTVTAPRG